MKNNRMATLSKEIADLKHVVFQQRLRKQSSLLKCFIVASVLIYGFAHLFNLSQMNVSLISLAVAISLYYIYMFSSTPEEESLTKKVCELDGLNQENESKFIA
ncbi:MULTISPECIES: hypothetical protein [Vibrio harveyi group]|uniref:hypothetical protein n=1 Tax=Vibrio harveyi group TaxID=717610 RepID=UPI000A2FEDDB|nr:MULTISPECIES: hypothetical protein [Vibrio harveyi group]ARR10598.1 unknow [Vibrio campbellii]WHP52926.1 hypothetical protein QMY43_25250 [Vibrio parahaemolyticus]